MKIVYIKPKSSTLHNKDNNGVLSLENIYRSGFCVLVLVTLSRGERNVAYNLILEGYRFYVGSSV